MELEGLPGENLKELLKGPKASRQDEEGVGAGAHESFARMHRLRNMELGEAIVSDFKIDEDPGDHTDDVTSGRERGPGDSPHQTRARPTVDETDPLGGKGAPKLFGIVSKDGTRAFGGGAEHGDCADGRHEVDRLDRRLCITQA